MTGRRRLLLWALLLVLATVVTTVLVGTRGPNELPLDPDNPGDHGLRALERVLEEQGVTVEVARGLSDLQSRRVDSTTTVLVVGTTYLSPESGRAVLEHAAPAARVVVLSPDDNAGEAFGVPVTVTRSVSSATLTPLCDLPLVRPGEPVSGADALITVTGERSGAIACYPPSAGYQAGGATAGHLVQVTTAGGVPLTLVGLGAALTNAEVTRDANAAVGLRLLGGTGRLLWYIPGPGDGGAGATPDLLSVLPPAVVPAVLLLLLALAATMVWRGRRLGAVVTEPLPAVIRSVETTLSRSRMYHKADDRSRALASLQLAARRRLAARLALGPVAPTEAVVRAVAEASGRHTEDVRRVLADPAAADDETLVRIARELRSLEEGIGNR